VTPKRAPINTARAGVNKGAGSPTRALGMSKSGGSGRAGGRSVAAARMVAPAAHVAFQRAGGSRSSTAAARPAKPTAGRKR
jgi:hypothetical protein